jgi:hypothetical protein
MKIRYQRADVRAADGSVVVRGRSGLGGQRLVERLPLLAHLRRRLERYRIWELSATRLYVLLCFILAWPEVAVAQTI